MKAIAGPILVTAAAHALLLGGFVLAHRGDPAVLVCAGQERMGRSPYECIRVGFERFGYDGQFYYALARGPWRRHDAGIDFAAGRQLRILYPAVSWLLSGGGDARLLLWVMPLVNVLAIAGLAGLGAAFARRQGLCPWWGCLLPLAVNAGMPALRNLTDVLSTLAVAGLLTAWLRRPPAFRQDDPWWELAPWAAAAALCREQNVAIVLAVLAVAGWRRQGRTCAALTGCLALWAGWACALRATYGTWPFLPTQGNFGPPLAAFLACWPHPGAHAVAGHTVAHAACLAFVAGQVLLALYLAPAAADPVLFLLLLAGVALAVLGGPSLYEDKWSFTRVLAWLPLGLWLTCVWTRRRWALAALAAPALLPVAVVLKACLSGA
jgi:hypothetical protein